MNAKRKTARRPAAKAAKRKRGKSKLAKRGPWKLNDAALLAELGLTVNSSSGAEVTEEKVLSLSAILCGLGRYAKLLASLPLHVYKKLGGRRTVADHLAAHWLLHTEPNPEMTAYSARFAVEWNRLAGGKGCYEIEWADNGHPRYLWPLEAWRVKEQRDEDEALYYLIDGQRRLAPGDMLYVPLITTDGVCGFSFLDYAVDCLGLAISAQDLAAAFFAGGGKPGGILNNPKTPGDADRKKFREEWNAARKKQPGSVGVTWGGWEYQDKGLTIPPDQQQLLDSRRFSTEEIARLLDIPPALLHDLTKSAWNNVELQNIALLVYSLNPVLVSYEQEYDRKLLNPPTVYSKYKVEGLLRAESDKRAAYGKEQFMFGGATINDWLRLNDQDEIGEEGDIRFVPANMVPLHKAIAAAAPEPTQVPAAAPTPDNIEKIPTPGEPPDPAAPAEPAGEPAPATNADGAAAQGDIQATALNGAQIASLIQVISAVALDQMPADTAKAALEGSFPLMGKALINSIIDPVEVWKKTRPPAPASPAPAPPATPALRMLLIDTLGRLARKEANAARRAAKDLARLDAWAGEFYSGRHNTTLQMALQPIMAALAIGDDGHVAAAGDLARAWTQRSRIDLFELAQRVTPATFAAEAEKLFAAWETERPQKTAEEVIRG